MLSPRLYTESAQAATKPMHKPRQSRHESLTLKLIDPNNESHKLAPGQKGPQTVRLQRIQDGHYEDNILTAMQQWAGEA